METIKHCTDLSEENDNQWQSLHHSMIPRIVLSVLLQEESTDALKSNAGNVEQMKMKLLWTSKCSPFSMGIYR